MGFPNRNNLWRAYLKGLANTHTMKSQEDAPRWYCDLREEYPTPNDAYAFCTANRDHIYNRENGEIERAGFPSGATSYLDKDGKYVDKPRVYYGAVNPAASLCAGGEMWRAMSSALKRCDRDGLRHLLLQEDRKKWDVGDFSGWGHKGIDMMLLDAGCPQIVGDRHMIRLVRPDFTETQIHNLQRSERKYDEAIEDLEKLALSEGATEDEFGLWHVAKWLESANKNRDPNDPTPEEYILGFDRCGHAPT